MVIGLMNEMSAWLFECLDLKEAVDSRVMLMIEGESLGGECRCRAYIARCVRDPASSRQPPGLSRWL